MRRPRYLLIAGADREHLASARAKLAAYPELRCKQIANDAALWTFEGQAPVMLNDHSVIVGPLFQLGRQGAITELSPEIRDCVIASQGNHLLRYYWGRYVAIIAEPERERVTLLRAPMGDLPCLIARGDGALVIASDVDLLIASGVKRPTVNWPALVRHLAAPDVRRTETCLLGVSELPGGSRLAFANGVVNVTPHWSPWHSAGRDRQIYDPQDAQRRLRHAVEHAVAMLATDQKRILLKLSGGLDSSIVGAALARSGGKFDCLNLVTRDATGDERRYAQLAARSAGRPLIERQRSLEHIDLTRSAASRLPRPAVRSFTQASTWAVTETAAATGATAVFDGGGGDNVFCSMQSVRPVLDCLLDANGRRAFLRTARSVAAVAQVSLWDVLRKSWWSRRRLPKPYPWPVDRRFLSSWAIAEAATAAVHPWFDPPLDALPGKAAHVALIAQAQSVAEGPDVEDELPTFSPLLAQPVVETCLMIPSWDWFDGSLNRAAARAAFAEGLPPEIAGRASKGSPDGFIAELYERNRPVIASMLLDGELARADVIERSAVRTILDDQRPVVGHEHLRILQLIDVEAWVRGWLDSTS